MTTLRIAVCYRRIVAVALGVCALWPALIEAAPGRSNRDALDRDVSSRVVLRKCVAGDGGIAYQSAPCVPGSRELWSREEALATSQTPPPPVVDSPRSRRAGTVTATRGGDRTSSRQRCDAARRVAAQRRDREWNRLKFDDLSRLDAWVAERCR